MTDHLGLNIADLVALLIVLIGLIVGFKSGLSSQMAVFMTALAVWAALVNGLDPCRTWLASRFAMPPGLAQMAALLILIVTPICTVLLLYSLLRYVLKITFTTWIDRLGGAVAGALTAAGIVGLVFMLVNVLPESKRPAAMGTESWITRNVIGAETNLIERLSERVQSGENLIEKAREERANRREKWEN